MDVWRWKWLEKKEKEQKSLPWFNKRAVKKETKRRRERNLCRLSVKTQKDL